MEHKELMRRRPGQNGCCGCSLGALLGASVLAALGFWRLRDAARSCRAR